MNLNHEQQKERARKEAEHHQQNANVTGYNPYPAEHEFSGPGANQKEYKEVEENLKKHHQNRKPIYNKKHDLYE